MECEELPNIKLLKFIKQSNFARFDKIQLQIFYLEHLIFININIRVYF